MIERIPETADGAHLYDHDLDAFTVRMKRSTSIRGRNCAEGLP